MKAYEFISEDELSEGPLWDKTKKAAGAAAVGGALAIAASGPFGEDPAAARRAGEAARASQADHRASQSVDAPKASKSASRFTVHNISDIMTGEQQGKVYSIKSIDGEATMEIAPDSKQPKIAINVGKVIDFGDFAGGRIKIGNNPVETVKIYKPNTGSYTWGMVLDSDSPGLTSKLLKHKGTIKIEVNLFRTGPTVYEFSL